MCGTVYGYMHYKDLLGSIARIGYCISVPDFYLAFTTEKTHTVMDKSINL